MSDLREYAAQGIPAEEAVASAAETDEFVLADGTWSLPGSDDPLSGFLPGTTAIIDTAAIKAIPVQDRTPDALAPILGASGDIGYDTVIAVYDRKDLFSAPWVWWMLQELDLSAWLVEGWTDTEGSAPDIQPWDFRVKAHNLGRTVTLEDVLETNAQILDARSPGRFAGTDPEPRPGLRSGHIPGSTNIPFGMLKADAPHTFHDAATLQTLFASKGVDLSKPILTTCGSGVTACGLAYCALRAGAEDVRVYMGSWAEYGASTHAVEAGA